jgi:UbiD family decarboxylase
MVDCTSNEPPSRTVLRFFRPNSPILEQTLPELETVWPQADFVLEDHVDPREPLRDEGPFGDYTGSGAWAR